MNGRTRNDGAASGLGRCQQRFYLIVSFRTVSFSIWSWRTR